MVITNRLGIADSPTLAREEERISKKAATTLFEKNLLNDMPSGTWTTLQKIHTILFQDIYDFAGTLRTVNIAKGNFRFVPVMYLAEAVKTIDWSQIDKEKYLSAMERSPVNDLEIKAVLVEALTDNINNRELFMKGLDHSYYFEGYQLFKSEDL